MSKSSKFGSHGQNYLGMKNIITALLLVSNLAAFSQTNLKCETPKKLVENFFIAFHAQDTIQLKNFVTDGVVLASASLDSLGNTKLSTSDYHSFISSIASIPPEAKFEEIIHEFRIEENGLLATVTTPYSFHFNGELSHCGVNSFQLVNFNGAWKIVYLIDTRDKENCD